MGTQAELILNHPDRQEAETTLQLVQDEIRRLEKVFSLYDQSSALSRLNQQGVLHTPPLDLVRCLDDAANISRITNGAFDITVQPLWNLYARHFAVGSASPDGPDEMKIEATRALVDYKAIHNSSNQIRFTKPDMAITLNGIAQGYITDRVTELLNARGFINVLVDLGEIRGMGQREDGGDWRVGIRAPDEKAILPQKLSLRNKAIATSGGYGTRFTTSGDHHHLFDPNTGRSAQLWTSVSVIADDATRADALSTAFSCMPESNIRHITEALGISLIATNDGRTISIGG